MLTIKCITIIIIIENNHFSIKKHASFEKQRKNLLVCRYEKGNWIANILIKKRVLLLARKNVASFSALSYLMDDSPTRVRFAK